jgi:large-conductance mechanosensitive channel
MDSGSFYKIYNFLKGAFWAYLTLGSLVTFSIFSVFGFFSALFFSFSFILFSLFMLLVIDILVKRYENYSDIKQQNALLEEIRDLLK